MTTTTPSQQWEPSRQQQRRRPGGYRFPSWWFVVMALPTFMPMLIGTAFVSIVWPLCIDRLAGYRNKAMVLAMSSQVGTVLGWTSPFFGSWSDRTSSWVVRRFGRRRSFILGGGVIHVLGEVLIYTAVWWLDTPSLALLGVGLIIKNLGMVIASAVWQAVVPETVPLEQRGLSITITSWLVSVCALLGNGVSWVLGEGYVPWVSAHTIWWGNICMVALNVPLQLLACNGEAGWWQAEHAPVPQPAAAPARPPAARRERQRAGPCASVCDALLFPADVRARKGVHSGLVAAVLDFIESLKTSPAYRYYFVFVALNSFANMIDTSFTFFWLQDCFTEFTFFGFVVASNVKSATALQGILSSSLPIFAISLMRPHKWRDRFGGRQMVLWTSLLLYFCRPFTFVIWQGEFTVVLLWTVFQSTSPEDCTQSIVLNPCVD